MRFWITGPTAHNLHVEVLDVIVSDGGQTLLPAGVTPHSLVGALTVGDFPDAYTPDMERKIQRVQVTTTGEVDSVKFGAIRVSMTPAGDERQSGSIQTTSAISVVAIVIPEGFDGDLSELQLISPDVSSLVISTLGSLNIFVTLLPDIPGIINRGPIVVSQTLTDTSQSPMFVATDWSFDQSVATIF